MHLRYTINHTIMVRNFFVQKSVQVYSYIPTNKSFSISEVLSAVQKMNDLQTSIPPFLSCECRETSDIRSLWIKAVLLLPQRRDTSE